MAFGVVNICFCCQAAQCGSDSEWSNVVGFQFGSEGGCEDGVEGIWWELAICDPMDGNGEWFNVVWVFVEWLPVLVAGSVGARVLT